MRYPGYNGRPSAGVCPSGQRERSVKPPAQPTEVRILPPPSHRPSCTTHELRSSAPQRALHLAEVSEVAFVSALLACKERNGLSGPSPINRCLSRARPAAVQEPRTLALHEGHAIRVAPEPMEDPRHPRVDFSIRPCDGLFQAALDLDRRGWMSGARQRRPRFVNHRRAHRTSAQRTNCCSRCGCESGVDPHESMLRPERRRRGNTEVFEAHPRFTRRLRALTAREHLGPGRVLESSMFFRRRRIRT
jgi:hypothetical protein